MQTIEVPRDDTRVDELIQDPDAYFQRIRVQARQDAASGLEQRIAHHRQRGLRALLGDHADS